MSAAPLLLQACSVLQLTFDLSEHVVSDMPRSRFVNMANADKVWSHLHSRDSTFPWEDFLDRSCLSLPSALDLSRPEHVAEPAPVAQTCTKKPRLETFSVAGSSRGMTRTEGALRFSSFKALWLPGQKALASYASALLTLKSSI